LIFLDFFRLTPKELPLEFCFWNPALTPKPVPP
jgi:hypothetical protein